MRWVEALRSRWSSESFIAAVSIVFLAWFSMKFYMDNSNDSETEAYVATLLSSAAHGTVPTDATGHYTALAPYVLWPFTALLQLVTRGWEIRGFVFSRLFLGVVVYAAAYLWYRRLGLSWFTSLIGLMLLSTSFAFAQLIHGWELDQLIEPALFLLAGLTAWNGRFITVLVLTGLAAANRETGAFVPIVVLAGLARQDGGLRLAIKRWPVWASVVISAAVVAWFRQLAPPPVITPWRDLNIERLVYVTGGLCLSPLLAVAWLQAAPLSIRRLFYILVPTWTVFVLATDRLEQGAVMLSPLALLFVPVTLAGVEQVIRAPKKASAPPT